MVAKIKKISKRGNYKDTVISVLLLAIFLGAIGFFIFSSWKISQKRSEMASRIESLQSELEELEEKSENLRSGINEAQTDYYWEERAREQGYKKPGEETVVVLPSEEQMQSEPQAPETFLGERCKKFFSIFYSQII